MNNIYVTESSEASLIVHHSEIKILSNAEFVENGEPGNGSSFIVNENSKHIRGLYCLQLISIFHVM